MLYIFGPGYLKAPFKLSRLYIQFLSGLFLDRLVIEEVNRSQQRDDRESLVEYKLAFHHDLKYIFLNENLLLLGTLRCLIA